MTPKFTPGPWGFSESELTAGRFSIYHNGPLGYVGDNGLGTENARANARLIAAAPDLLDALRRLVHPMADDTDLDNARDVIARALGEA